MPSKKLDLALSDDEATITINKEYAKNYESWRKKEELQKFKDKYGTDNVDELDEDGEDSDSASSVEAVEWTADDERNFLRTLGALKAKDPKIYRDDVKFFNEPERSDDKPKPSRRKDKKQKPMTLRDYEQKLVVERGGRLSEDDYEEDDDGEPTSNGTLKGPSYSEKEAQLKRELKNMLNDFSADEDEEDGLLKRRVKTVEEKKAEEDEYYEWLKDNRHELPQLDEDLKNLKKKWQEPQLDDNERFLRDYILNKKYETDGDPLASGDLPTYEEILREDEEEDKRDEFEVKYNFRFEEPDQDFIKQFPRTVKESLRKPDTRRKELRERRQQRKNQEKKERQEEIRQMKAIQRAEMEKKMKKLREMAGDEDLPFDLDDLNKDFDPEEHDRKMRELNERIDDEDLEEEAHEQSFQPATSSAAGSTSKPEVEFRYRPVEPNSFGLTTDEILKLDDRQLNAWVSVKKVTGYLPTHEELNDKQLYERKAQNPERKRKILSAVAPKAPKSKKIDQEQQPISSEPLNTTGKKKRHRKRKSNTDLDAQRLRSYGVSTQKLKSTLFKKKQMPK